MKHGTWRILVGASAALIAVTLSGCLRIVERLPVPVQYPRPTGPYAVGLTSYHWVDSARTGVFSDPVGTLREIMAYVYYPAVPNPGAAPSLWLDAAQIAAISSELGVSQARIEAIQANSYRAAALAPSEKPWPVLVFSHGNGVTPMNYTALLEELASQGYVVIAPSHTGNAFVTAFPGGRAVKARDAGNPNPARASTETGFAAIDAHWSWVGGVLSVIADDDLFVMDQAGELARSDPRFQGRIDAARIGVLGHSFGGAAAVECAIRGDPRVVAAIDIDGTLYSSAAMAGIGVPFLLVTNAEFAKAREIYAAREEQAAILVDKGFTREQAELTLDRGLAQWLAYERSPVGCFAMIEGSLHCNFCDYDVLAQEFPEVPTFQEDMGSIDPDRFREVAWPCIVAFLERFVKGSPASLLEGPSPYPEVVWESHGL